jgi:hypothetical protein
MVKKNSKSKKGDKDEKIDPVKDKIDAAIESLKVNWEAALDKLPPTISDFITFILTKLAAWRMLFVAFTAGAVLTFGAILIPVHGSTVASLTQPVTLFETILTDLEQAYVDPLIRTNRSETGVSAMLRSAGSVHGI